MDSYQFDDVMSKGEDVFARDPYILRFSCPTTGGCHQKGSMWRSCEHTFDPFFLALCAFTSELKDLVMIPVHTKPEDSEKELDELHGVFLDVNKKWGTDVRPTETWLE